MKERECIVNTQKQKTYPVPGNRDKDTWNKNRVYFETRYDIYFGEEMWDSYLSLDDAIEAATEAEDDAKPRILETLYTYRWKTQTDDSGRDISEWMFQDETIRAIAYRWENHKAVDLARQTGMTVTECLRAIRGEE